MLIDGNTVGSVFHAGDEIEFLGDDSATPPDWYSFLGTIVVGELESLGLDADNLRTAEQPLINQFLHLLLRDKPRAVVTHVVPEVDADALQFLTIIVRQQEDTLVADGDLHRIDIVRGEDGVLGDISYSEGYGKLLLVNVVECQRQPESA